eukprot:7298755-Prymnesium_polylepis.1
MRVRVRGAVGGGAVRRQWAAARWGAAHVVEEGDGERARAGDEAVLAQKREQLPREGRLPHLRAHDK